MLQADKKYYAFYIQSGIMPVFLLHLKKRGYKKQRLHEKHIKTEVSTPKGAAI